MYTTGEPCNPSWFERLAATSLLAGQWSITSQRADSTMTPAKTATVMNFMAWLFTPSTSATARAEVSGLTLSPTTTAAALFVLIGASPRTR